MTVSKVVCSLSGGLDSTTLLYHLVRTYGQNNVAALSFDYGQKHNIELSQARRTAQKLGVAHTVIPMTFLSEMVAGVSSMVAGGLETPTYEDIENGGAVTTYVPFRNLILTSICLSFAESVGADAVALGIQFGDYNGAAYHYWDCGEAFHKNLQKIADLNDRHHIEFMTPFVDLTKAEIVRYGNRIGVPFEDTWSCYDPVLRDGRYFPCGKCPTCRNRTDAFLECGLKDPLFCGLKDPLFCGLKDAHE